MKKAGILFLAALLLLAACAVLASAEESEPFTFQIKSVNGQIGGEDCVICTTQEAYDACNPKWAITLLCRVQEDGTLLVAEQPISGGGSLPDVEIGNGIVAVVVHSSTSDPALSEQYPNVYSKLAALSATPGMVLVLEGVDLENGTGRGSATLYESAPAVGEGSGTESVAESSAESVAADSSEEASSAESVAAEESVAESVSVSKAESSDDVSEPAVAVESTVSGSQPGGLSSTTVVLLVLAAAVLVIAIVAVTVTKRKK